MKIYMKPLRGKTIMMLNISSECMPLRLQFCSELPSSKQDMR